MQLNMYDAADTAHPTIPCSDPYDGDPPRPPHKQRPNANYSTDNNRRPQRPHARPPGWGAGPPRRWRPRGAAGAPGAAPPPVPAADPPSKRGEGLA